VAYDDQEQSLRIASLDAAGKRPLAVDLFCGVGGMGLGFERAGFDVVAAVEIDPLLAAVHRYNHPRTRTVCADVSSLRDSAREMLSLGTLQLDLVFGGPPCQGFSIIGKRQVDDSRNRLVDSFVSVAIEMNPKFIVMENVEGILQPAMNQHLERAKKMLVNAGYKYGEPKRIDASLHGVPQRRKRVFLVAWRPEHSFEWPAETHGGPDSGLHPFVTVKDAIGDLAWETPFAKSSYAAGLANGASVGLAAPREAVPMQLSGLDRTEHSAQTTQRFRATEPGKEEPISRYTRLRWDGLCHTMRAGTGPDRGAFMGARPIHPSEPRVITVREAARLHSYPDWFQFHRTKWHSFRGIGNSVPPLMAEAIGRAVVAGLGANPTAAASVALGKAEFLGLSPAAAAELFSLDVSALPKRKRS